MPSSLVRLFRTQVQNAKASRWWQIHRFTHDHHRRRRGGRRYFGKASGGNENRSWYD